MQIGKRIEHHETWLGDFTVVRDLAKSCGVRIGPEAEKLKN